MSTAIDFPDFDAFCANEFRTLEYLNARRLFKDYTELANSINQSYLEYFAQNKEGVFKDFNFHSDFDMEVQNHLHKVIIGANVKKGFDECSYFLAVAGKDKHEKKLVRKFHFDYAIAGNATTQPVPTFHCQYGGELSPQLGNMELSGKRLDSWLSVPRLNYFPVNLALLLDILFCEFRTQETNLIVEDPEWRTLIYNNESLVTLRYLNNIQAHISSQQYTRNKLIRDFCYGN